MSLHDTAIGLVVVEAQRVWPQSVCGVHFNGQVEWCTLQWTGGVVYTSMDRWSGVHFNGQVEWWVGQQNTGHG